MSKYNKLSLLVLAMAAFLAAAVPAGAVTYYWNGGRSDEFINVTKWWTNPGGSGTNPTLAELTNTGGNAICLTQNLSIKPTNASLAAGGTQNFDASLIVGVSTVGQTWAPSTFLNSPEFNTESGNSNCTYYWRDLRFRRGYISGYQTNGRHWTGNITVEGPVQWQIRNGQTFYVDAAVEVTDPNMYIAPWRPSSSGAYPSTANFNWGPSSCMFFGKWVVVGKIIGTTAGAFGEGDFQLYGVYSGTYDPGDDRMVGTLQINNADAISTNARIDMSSGVYLSSTVPASKLIVNAPVTIRWATYDGVDIPAGTYTTADGLAWFGTESTGSLTITQATQRNLTMACPDPNSRTMPPIGSTKAFVEGRAVKIKAYNDPKSAYSFDYWESSTGSGIANIYAAETTVTIPVGSDITVTAHYKPSASNPSPVTGASNVGTYTNLTWTPVSVGLTSQEVYFGTDNPPTTLVGSGTSLNSLSNAAIGGPLADYTTYYWMVKSNGFDGFIWSFITGSSTPNTPSPSNNAKEVAVSPTLTWVADNSATSYDVYFSTNQALVAAGDSSVKTAVTAPTLAQSNLARGMMYYWKVAANYTGGVTKVGPVWSFRVNTYKLYLKTGTISTPATYSIDGAADVNAVVDDANMAIYKLNVNYNSQWDIVVTGSRGAAIWSDNDIVFDGAFSVSAPNYVTGTNAGTPIAGGYLGQAKSADSTPWADVAISGPGRGTKVIGTWPGGGGGGYGGTGGTYGYLQSYTTGGWGGSPYGEPELFTLWGGSGGGAGLEAPAGSGGGIIEIYSKGSITLGANAAVSSNGGTGATVSRTGSGGGSGGSIRLVAAGNVNIAGSVTANGGGGCDVPSSNQGGGGGAGGRIAIYQGGSYVNTGVVAVTGGLHGGTETATNGQDGTIYNGNASVLMAAHNMYPANNSLGVAWNDPNTRLAWNPALGSLENKLYFGTSSGSLSLVATYSDANGLRARKSYAPTLAEATQYYWRVDTDGVAGQLMTFKTRGREALNPDPADGATGVETNNPTLSWDMFTSSGTKWEVYFGTSPASLTLKKTITDPNELQMNYNAGQLLANTTYYWRVDETSNQKWTGYVWSFTTRAPICAAATKPVGDLDGDCKVTFKDMALLANNWKVCNLYPSTDCN